MKPLDRVMTVDTGWNTAWAFWRLTSLDPLIPRSDVITLPKIFNSVEEKLSYMWDKFERDMDRLKPNLVVLESTEYWEDSLKSKTSHKRGDVHTLTLLIGGYADSARHLSIPFTFILAREWKGNMSDVQVQRRVRYVNGKWYENCHEADAVGIGLSKMKLFNIRKQAIE